tara:strand:- start:1632 stop:1751 length:120 start_codon:yes stop_codon:yes gene_type:complete
LAVAVVDLMDMDMVVVAVVLVLIELQPIFQFQLLLEITQ